MTASSISSAAAQQTGGVVRLGRRRSSGHERAEQIGFTDPGPIDGQLVYSSGGYRASQVSTLMARYVRIRGDLLLEHSGLGPEEAQCEQAATVCAGFLASARKELESRHSSLSVVANLLGMAERMLVSLYRPQILRLRLHTLQDELRSVTPRPVSQIATIRYTAHELETRPTDDLSDVRTTLKDALTFLSAREEQSLIEDDLQVRRLSAVLTYLVIGWLLLLAAVPVVSSVQSDGANVVWPVLSFGGAPLWDLLAGAVGLSVVGAVGGVVSGMLDVRDTRATMLDYRTSLKRLSMKPVAGAIAALVVYLFLSAGVVSGVAVTSAGIYVVLAFVAGFSERYFLRVINAQVPAGRVGPSTSRASEGSGSAERD